MYLFIYQYNVKCTNIKYTKNVLKHECLDLLFIKTAYLNFCIYRKITWYKKERENNLKCKNFKNNLTKS